MAGFLVGWGQEGEGCACHCHAGHHVLDLVLHAVLLALATFTQILKMLLIKIPLLIQPAKHNLQPAIERPQNFHKLLDPILNTLGKLTQLQHMKLADQFYTLKA